MSTLTERKIGLKLSRTAYVLLLILGSIAFLLSWVSVFRYIDSIRSVRSLDLAITDLAFIDDNNPRVEIYLRLYNPSPLAMKVNYYFFTLYLDGEKLGTSSSTYIGTDPDVDPGLYSRASRIDQILAPQQHLDLIFTLYMYTTQQNSIRDRQQSDTMSWSADVGFWMIIPHTREETLVRLKATLE